MYILKKNKKIEQYHKLLLVLGGDLALTRSYSERWQVARIGLCGRGAVCGAGPDAKFSLFRLTVFAFSTYRRQVMAVIVLPFRSKTAPI